MMLILVLPVKFGSIAGVMLQVYNNSFAAG